MKGFEFGEQGAITKGVVTLTDWMLAADGQSYKYLFAERWEVVTDKAMPIDGFHSSEKWTLIGVVNGQPVVIIPGCKVYAWCFAVVPPQSNSTLDIRTLLSSVSN